MRGCAERKSGLKEGVEVYITMQWVDLKREV